MFATFRCSPSRGPPKLIDLAENSTTFEIGMPHHFACQSCRERKLRCDGHRPCCEWCEDGNIKCEYIASNTRRSRRSRPPDAGDTTETVKRLCSPEKELSTVSSAASVSLYHLQSHGGAANDLPWLQSVDPGQPSSPDANGFMFLAGPEATDLADMDDWLQSTSRLLDNDRDQRLLSYHNDWSLEKDNMNGELLDTSATRPSDLTTLFSDPVNTRTTRGFPLVSDRCCCVEGMLECLDDLERRADGTIIARITSALDQQRRAWKQCQTLFSCHECCHKRSTVTLLTMSYERIVEFFHRALAEDLAQRPQELGRTLPGVTFGQYELGTQDEVFAVLQALVAVRLKEMSSDVGLMQSRENDGIRDLYKVRLRAVGDKVKDIAAQLRCLNCPEIA